MLSEVCGRTGGAKTVCSALCAAYDGMIPRAAADIALKRSEYIRFRGIGIVEKKRGQRYGETGSAIAALKCILLGKAVLEDLHERDGIEAFRADDLRILYLPSHDKTAVDGTAVH
jgi:hypothetical protein